MVQQTIKAVVFDWGDTLMTDFTEYSGPMVDWPRVEVVAGVTETLKELKGSYRLALATNAAESGESRVRGALRRVDLEGYFDAVFTARELNARKPDGAFFQAVANGLGCDPAEMVMVGDNYLGDIQGAKDAGWKAVWYNPTSAACPKNLPGADAEITSMQDLPRVLRSRWLPDVQTCLAWMVEKGATPRLLKHVWGVAGVAYLLAVRLRAKGDDVNPWMAHRGGLLHDLDKGSFAQTGLEHGELAQRWLIERDEPELGEIAFRHLLGGIMDDAKKPRTWEQKLVFFADKLVEQDQVVPVAERFEALQKRYPSFAAEMNLCLPKVLDLEIEICQKIEMHPAEMIAWLRTEVNPYSGSFS